MADLTERLNEAIDDAAYGSSRRAVLIEARDLAQELYEAAKNALDRFEGRRGGLWPFDGYFARKRLRAAIARYEQECGE